MSILLCETAFNPWKMLAERHEGLSTGESGACASFIGTMRNHNQGDSVKALYLEHYPGMTDKQMLKIMERANEQWPLLDCLLVHRVGQVSVGETLILVATWSIHRGAAFDACQYMVEAIKHNVPFWKRETLMDGSTRWVDRNTIR